MTIIALTGHRPERIPNIELVREKVRSAFLDVNPEVVITGMAAGFDLIAGNVALDMEIPIVCAKPWKGHKPRVGDEEAYARLIKYADAVVNVVDSEEFPGSWCYPKRNQWMVDRADKVLACWDGMATGGTYQCVKYAQRLGVPIRRIDPGA